MCKYIFLFLSDHRQDAYGQCQEKRQTGHAP